MDDIRIKQHDTRDRVRQVEEQFHHWEQIDSRPTRLPTAKGTGFITISREYGCAGFRIGDRLAAALNPREENLHLPPWAVYDRKLVEEICRSHNLSRMLVESLDRQRRNPFSDYISGLFTGDPSSHQVFRKCAETIYGLAARGRAILIGRGSAIITGKLEGGLHLRVVAPLEWRVRQVMEFEGIESQQEARRKVEELDHERGRYVRDFLGHDLRDDHLYDLVLNQARLGIEGIVQLTVRAMELVNRD